MTATTDEPKKPPAKPDKGRARRPAPAREDWLDAGLEMIAETGADGLVAESLMRRVGGTKSTFAREFGDRTGFLDALIEYWELSQVDVLLDLHARDTAPGDKLREIFYALLPELEPGGPELAIRSWARRHLMAQTSVNAIDARRTVYLEDVFREIGCDDAEAALRASFYLGLIFTEGMIDRGEDTEDREARIALSLETVAAGV